MDWQLIASCEKQINITIIMSQQIIFKWFAVFNLNKHYK